MKSKLKYFFLLTIPFLLPQKGSLAEEVLNINPLITYTSYISEDIPESIGIAQGSPDEQFISGQDDLVYFYLTSPSLVTEGKSFSIIRVAGPIRHPITEKEMGYLIDPLGELRVIEKKGNTCLGKVTYSKKEIFAGDQMTPLLESSKLPIRIFKNPKDVRGYIIGNENESGLISQDDIVYIDLGEKDGLRRGDLLEVYQPVAQSQETWQEGLPSLLEGIYKTKEKGRVEMTEELLGTIVIITLKKTSSTALVLSNKKDIRTGDRIRTAK